MAIKENYRILGDEVRLGPCFGGVRGDQGRSLWRGSNV